MSFVSRQKASLVLFVPSLKLSSLLSFDLSLNLQDQVLREASANVVSFVFRAQSHERTAPPPAQVLEETQRQKELEQAELAAAKDELDAEE